MSGAATALPLVVQVMLDELDGAALAELERALRGRLTPTAENPAERRARRLGFLASLIERTGVARPPREDYDQLRPPSAPRGQELTAEFGLWRRACRAAEGVLPDGRINRASGENHPRTPGAREKTPTYSRGEILNAIRRCALATGRVPTSLAYERWREREVGEAKRFGKSTPRLPSLGTIARTFPRWRLVITAAAIDPRDLEVARTQSLPRLERPPARLSRHELEAIGARQLMTRKGAVAKNAVEQLPLSEALELCRKLGCSLEYLLGSGDRGRAPTGTRFAYEAWKKRLKASGVGERELLKRIRMPSGHYRHLLRGQLEPTLSQLAVFAALAAAPLDALLIEGEAS